MGVKKKDADKYILNPARKATKKANKIPFLVKAPVAVGAGVVGVSAIRDRNERKHRKYRQAVKKADQRRARTKSRASQRGVKKRP